MLTIGLFGPSDDQEIRALANRLEARGASPWIVDLGNFPNTMTISASEDMRFDGRPLLEMDAAYLRRASTTLPPEFQYDTNSTPPENKAWHARFDRATSELLSERARHPLRISALRWLARRRPLINPPDVQNLHRTKALELFKLSEAELPVPQLACGTSRYELEKFCAFAVSSGWSGVVTKPPAGIYKTHLVDENTLDSHRFEEFPALFQRYIEGDTIRCYALGGAFLTASKIVHKGTVDSSMSQTGLQSINLSERGKKIVEDTAKTLDLDFCGMDLMIDNHTGEEFVIDCNMSPMFVNYGYLSGIDIAGHLADRLIERANSRKCYERPAVVNRVEEMKTAIADDPELASLLRKTIRPRKS